MYLSISALTSGEHQPGDVEQAERGHARAAAEVLEAQDAGQEHRPAGPDVAVGQHDRLGRLYLSKLSG